jgi:hypothetical protein
LGEAIGFKLRKSAEFHFKYLVQFGTGFSCHEAPGKVDASGMYDRAGQSHGRRVQLYIAKISRISLQKFGSISN